jgi:NAD(P)-dependent dehydrogenase (short-subunit alcohol dehydrogenase family)
VTPLLEHTRAVIIGGTGGIGRAVAAAFIDQGCQVTVTGATTEEIGDFATLGLGAEAYQLDVTDQSAANDLAAKTGQLDVLVNCAGIILRDQQEFTIPAFTKVIDVNLLGTMRMCLAFHRGLSLNRGCILNVASMLSVFGSGHVPAYSASKGGVVQLTKSLAIAWAHEGIRVNAIAPGWIKTNLTASLVADSVRGQKLLDRTPMGRWGVPEDVGGAAVFLCSRWASFITGAVLPVDGGYSAA